MKIFIKIIVLITIAGFVSVLPSCDSQSEDSSSKPTLTLNMEVAGYGVTQQAPVTVDGKEVADASIAVNGETIPYDTNEGKYMKLPMADSVVENDEVILEFEHQGLTAGATGAIPGGITVQEPLDGATVSAGDSIDVSWTSSSTPDRVRIQVTDDVSSEELLDESVYDGSTSYTIEANTISSGASQAEIAVSVFDYYEVTSEDFAVNESESALEARINEAVITLNVN